MINNDNEFQKAFNKYLKSKGADINSFISCEDIECDDCVLGNLKDRHGFNVCLREPFKEMEKLKEDIELLKKEIEIIESWERKNSSSAKETWEEEEKIYAEIQRLITKNGELTKEIDRLYRKLDKMEKEEK